MILHKISIVQQSVQVDSLTDNIIDTGQKRTLEAAIGGLYHAFNSKLVSTLGQRGSRALQAFHNSLAQMPFERPTKIRAMSHEPVSMLWQRRGQN